MPDWVSHILIGLIICEVYDINKKSLVLLGTLLPDFIGRIYLVGLILSLPPGIQDYIIWFGMPGHTLIGMFLLALAATPLFNYDFKKTLQLISIGLTSHILADLTTKHFMGGITIFFPFTAKNYTLNVLWQEQFYIVLISSALVLLLIKGVKRKGVKKRCMGHEPGRLG